MKFNFKLWLEAQKHDYSAVLFLIPEEITQKIKNFSIKNINSSNLYELEGGREDESHVTILYGLNNNNLNEIKNKLKGFKPFKIKLGKISKFDNKDEYDVIKFDVEGKGLFDLNRKLKEIPHYSTYKDYKPHCTLAYVKKGNCDKLIGKNPIDQEIEVKEVYFVDTNKKKTKIQLQ